MSDNLTSIGGAWVSYTPTITVGGTAITLGNGTIDAAYKLLGDKTCAIRVTLSVGSSTSLGTGTVNIGLPSGASAKSSSNGLGPGTFMTSAPYGMGAWFNTSQTQLALIISGGSGQATVASLGLTSGSVLRLGGIYEVG